MQNKLFLLIYCFLASILISQFPESLDVFIELKSNLDKLLLKGSSTASITTGS